ncbi:MAG: WG repeat-containing protein [Bacteroides sp.]|nr:WG repeat-containing protein [Bacteroides sp.]
MGNRITVPPIYRNIRPPIGKYCAVEKNYSQWGIITIDGRLLVDAKYPDVVIERNGMAWLTQMTGKKMRVQLE